MVFLKSKKLILCLPVCRHSVWQNTLIARIEKIEVLVFQVGFHHEPSLARGGILPEKRQNAAAWINLSDALYLQDQKFSGAGRGPKFRHSSLQLQTV